jgi:hypothetical protein
MEQNEKKWGIQVWALKGSDPNECEWKWVQDSVTGKPLEFNRDAIKPGFSPLADRSLYKRTRWKEIDA